MRFHRQTLTLLFLALTSLGFAQSDAQKSFDKMKTLTGSWEGQVTTTPQVSEFDGRHMHVTLRTTSMGNALIHEMVGKGVPTIPSRCYIWIRTVCS